MFETLNFDKALDEELFDTWLENGRNSRLGYQYLLIIWHTMEEDFKPKYIEQREDIEEYRNPVLAQETLVAVYDLYSESRISLN